MTIKDRSGQVQILKCKKFSLVAFYILSVLFVAGNPTFKSLSQFVGRSCFAFFVCIFSCLTVEKLRYEYFIDVNAPALLITTPALLITAPAQLISAFA